MSYIVKGKSIPSCCGRCTHLNDDGDFLACRITKEQRGYNFDIYNNTMQSCPLVELPKSHGRLIDADYLIRILQDTIDNYPDTYNDGAAIEKMIVSACKSYIEHCLTVVDAEE